MLSSRAVAAAIEAVTGLATELKHPNDVLVGGRKVAGVLAEATEGRVVLGIGINVNVPVDALPTGVRLPATSLLAEGGRPIDRIQLAVELLDRLEGAYDAWNQAALRLGSARHTFGTPSP